MKKKRRRKQITCTCSAYSFPHRLSGGKCTLVKYAERTHGLYFGSGVCLGCICFKSGSCEVAEGIESPKYCQAVQELEHWNELKLCS